MGWALTVAQADRVVECRMVERSGSDHSSVVPAPVSVYVSTVGVDWAQTVVQAGRIVACRMVKRSGSDHSLVVGLSALVV